jgi:hypothetical protein
MKRVTRRRRVHVPQPTCEACGATLRHTQDGWRCCINGCAAYWQVQAGATGASTSQPRATYSSSGGPPKRTANDLMTKEW